MKKIVMFFGSDRAFVERIPKTYRNLSDIAMQMDDENKQMQLVLVGLPGNENAPFKRKKKQRGNKAEEKKTEKQRACGQ